MSKQNYNHQQPSNSASNHLISYKNSIHIITRSLQKPYLNNPREKYTNQSRHLAKIDDKERESLSKTQVTVNQKNHQIYFSRTKKYNYMRQIIDKYFDESKKDNMAAKYHTVNPQDHFQNKKHISFMPRLIKKQLKDSKEKKQSLANIDHHLSLISKRKNKPKANIKLKSQQDQDLQNSGLLNMTTSNQQDFPPPSSTNNSISLRNISIASTKNLSNLPPINQQYEQKQYETLNDQKYQSIFSLINESQELQDYKEEKIMLVQNQIYFIQLVLVNDRINHKLKTYKEKGEQILNRQLKAIKLGIEPIWIQYKFNFKSLVTYPNKSLKELLFKIKSQDPDGKLYAIKSKKYHKKLLSSNCQQLRRVIVDYCEHMKKFQGKILNNKVCLGNIFLSKNDNIRLGQWGYASFRQTHLIQHRQFQNRKEPIVKSQKEWFVPPEYLAPEILKAIIGNQDIDLMNNESASDIWSLGIVLFEILTMIPVGAIQKFAIQGKSIMRNGILAFTDIKKMITKLQKLSLQVQRLIQEQLKQEKVNSRIIQVIVGCLEYCPENRLNYQDIIEILR